MPPVRQWKDSQRTPGQHHQGTCVHCTTRCVGVFVYTELVVQLSSVSRILFRCVYKMTVFIRS